MGANADWQARSLASVWHPCTQMQRAAVVPPLPIARAQGPWLYDHEGRRYFDANSSWWVNLFGHADAGIVEALKAQLETLPHVMLAGCTHAPAVELAERLSARTGGVLGHAFYASDGASAVEIALKMSFHHWRNTGRGDKREFVCVRQGYHGETLGALSVTDVPVFRDAYDPLLLRAHQVASPDARLVAPGEDAEAMALRAAADLETLLTEQHGRIAALIVEPLVQCAAGMAMHHPAYLRRVRALCDRFEVHLIADEIAVGCGRTGTFFASEQAGIWPDFLCLSKGITGGFMPLSLVLCRDAVYRAFLSDDVARGFLHSHSYTGNALACRAALAVLDRFEAQDVLGDNAREAARLDGYLAPLAQDPRVEHLRRLGTIWAFDVRPEHAQGRFAENFHRVGRGHELLVRPIGRTVYLMPPYVLDDATSRWLAERLLATLHDTLQLSDADRAHQPPVA
ncbi:adenosylmethionine--8-amino-7-oxononanoate transaminase [Macromonas nakdongensis]|uniref:adenosylmethionine--8-amino-7-oxononanoate transaminase n=1 Tax=Macromonas nakdongensis TaxID=1843082 RepID=UPI000C34B86C|nr:adenosylmethionine--8-amino-7-oxononanoate transaminase [Macromonas nakdongensis]